MKKALELAEKGAGYTNPNPLVGAIIVKDNRIIARGYHHYYGGVHAEVDAFNNAKEDVKGATMYVTLEPCSHYGKTPPCANKIVEKGIKTVVVAMKDPNPLVAGKGIDILQQKGIDVIIGVCEAEAKKLNEIFIKFITTKMPFSVIKTAMTLDGKIATFTGDSKWITNADSRQYVHQLRHRMAAIMVGINTVLSDNPRLTTRLEQSEGKDPIRIIVDSKGKIPLDANVFTVDSKGKTIIATTCKANQNKIQAIQAQGAEVIMTPLKNDKVDLLFLMKALGKKGIDSVLIEGGSTLNAGLLDAGVVDKVITFIAPKIIGGSNAKTPIGGEGKQYMKEALTLHHTEVSRFGEDMMVAGYLKERDD